MRWPLEALKIAHLSASTPLDPILRTLSGRHCSTRCARSTKADSASPKPVGECRPRYLLRPTRGTESRPACRGPPEAPHHGPRASGPTAFAAVFPAFHYVEPLASSHRDATLEPMAEGSSVNLHEFKPLASHTSPTFAFGLELFSSFFPCVRFLLPPKSSLIEAFSIPSISRTVDRPRVIAH